MPDSTQSAPLLEGLLIGEPISEHHGIRCCPAIRENTDERYIVKTLSIPASQMQLDALLLTGAYPNEEAALEYFSTLAQEVLSEVKTLDKLSKLEGFLPFLGAEILPMENGTGWTVHLLSPYRRSLERQMQLQPLTHLGAVNLGLDLCAALAICRRSGYLYLDLKPSNIYVTGEQGYRIGDLGFTTLSGLKYASYPEKYRSIYTAPEIKDAMSTLSDTLDVYALGLVLYQVYNNGQLPSEDTASEVPPSAPMYADYEMAEIILKACDPDPAKRWADTIQMGQALVSYMQRNSVNDTPIIPPPVEEPEIPEVQDEEEFLSEEENEATVEELLENILLEEASQDEEPNTSLEDDLVAALDAVTEDDQEVPAEPEAESETVEDTDETLPSEEIVDELPDVPVSDDVEQILAQADDLLTIEVPEPPVAPEPIDVPFPAPITADEDPMTADLLEEVPAEDAQEDPSVQDEEPAQEDDQSIAGYEPTVPDSEVVVDEETLAAEYQQGLSQYEYACDNDQDPEDPEELKAMYRRPNKTARAFLSIACCLLLLLALGIGGTLYYQLYYLQPVEFLAIDGGVDSLTAIIGSGIRDELLEVICTDTYGNTRVSAVLHGRAHFSNLTPNTQYRVYVNINGFHELTGVTTGSFTTLAQTEIMNFTAVAGPEDGSAILSFTVNGPDTNDWTIGYRTDEETEKTISFTGHTVTIADLQVGSEYQFRLIPNDDQHLCGTWQLVYTPQTIICAQGLAISSYLDSTLVVTWDVPDALAEQSWNVRCYNDAGYDQTVTVQGGEAQFEGLDQFSAYTVDVTAVGMTQSASIQVTANPITLTGVTATSSESGLLLLQWTYAGEAPADGWILDYSVDGGTPVTLSCTETSAQIPNYPGSSYEIEVRPVGDVTFLGEKLLHAVEKAKSFSDYSVKAKDMTFFMCRTPNKKKWDRFDLKAKDYVTEFEVGEKASFLVELRDNPSKSKDEVQITYIIRDDQGLPLSCEVQKAVWNDMWSKRFCELDIPKMPETAGKYTIEIYFNDGIITTESFSVK